MELQKSYIIWKSFYNYFCVGSNVGILATANVAIDTRFIIPLCFAIRAQTIASIFNTIYYLNDVKVALSIFKKILNSRSASILAGNNNLL